MRAITLLQQSKEQVFTSGAQLPSYLTFLNSVLGDSDS